MTRLNIVLALAISLGATVVATPSPEAATISTSANCSLVEAIESANTNVAVGGCPAGTAGRNVVSYSNVT